MLAAPMRPVIGICGAIESARWGVWDAHAVLTPLDYVRAVQEAGGLALIVPPDPVFGEVPEQLLDAARRPDPRRRRRRRPLVLRRGAAPRDDGDRRRRATPRRSRSRARRSTRDLPVLGICRGMQLLNVARGGTLIQHLPESHGHDGHRPNPGSFDGSDLDVRLADGSLARARGGGGGPPDQAAPSPGRRRPRRRPGRHRLVGARRAARGRRASGAALRARRAVAPRGRPGLRGDRARSWRRAARHATTRPPRTSGARSSRPGRA